MIKIGVSALALVGAALVAAPALAQQTTIANGTGYSAGIGPNGELYDSNTGVGLRNPDGDDYIQPGTPRDSWGITSSAGSAYADYQDYGTGGINSTVITNLGTSAIAISNLTSGLRVTHDYNFFAPNILSIQQTVLNTTTSTISGIVFRRNVDLDIPPTTFNENVFGVLGSNAAVVGNSYYGFENPDPSSAFGYQCGSSCNQGGDLGAGIDLGLGSLAAGGSVTFAYYYGINAPGQTLAQLFTQAQGLGLNYLIGAQSRENGDYPNLGARSAFLGVNTIGSVAGAVPEPASWGMMILGFGLTGGALRHRRSKIAFARA